MTAFNRTSAATQTATAARFIGDVVVVELDDGRVPSWVGDRQPGNPDGPREVVGTMCGAARPVGGRGEQQDVVVRDALTGTLVTIRGYWVRSIRATTRTGPRP